MNTTTLAGLVPWIVGHGYLLFFILAVLEGSLVSTAAGVAAGLGFFNVFIVIALSVAVDLVGDVFYYMLGYYGHNFLKSRFMRFIGLNDRRIEETKKLLHTHTNKSLIVIKLSPLLGPPGIVTVGMVHLPFRKFFKSTSIISVCKSLLFVLLGFSSAQTYLQLSRTISHGQYVVVIIAAALLLIYYIYRKIIVRAERKLGK